MIAKLLTKDGVWQTMLRIKYIGSQALCQVYWKPGDSHFWADLVATKKYFFPYFYFSIKDGRTNGHEIPRSRNNILLYTISCVTKVIL
jgi:hypothetical protein